MAESEKPEEKKKKMDRRQFLVGSSAALAAGALAVTPRLRKKCRSSRTGTPKSLSP